jgi:hypothetical protein
MHVAGLGNGGFDQRSERNELAGGEHDEGLRAEG